MAADAGGTGEQPAAGLPKPPVTAGECCRHGVLGDAGAIHVPCQGCGWHQCLWAPRGCWCGRVTLGKEGQPGGRVLAGGCGGPINILSAALWNLINCDMAFFFFFSCILYLDPLLQVTKGRGDTEEELLGPWEIKMYTSISPVRRC